MKLTPTRRKNLLRLADYLDSLPENYGAFEMAVYLSNEGDQDRLNHYAQFNGGVPECGAVACAIGHGPSAGITFPAPRRNSPLWTFSSFSGHCEPNFDTYSARNFIDPFKNQPEWEWCFGQGWCHHDNHHWGAAARIRYLLAGKPVPEVHNFDGKPRPFDDSYIEPEHVALYQEFRRK